MIVRSNIRSTPSRHGYKLMTIFALGVGLATPALAQGPLASNDGVWLGRVWGAYSGLADTDGALDGTPEAALQPVDVSTSGGFAAGAAASYRFGSDFAVEFAWEYRSNDSQVDVDNRQLAYSGNYASNTFFLNGFYFLGGRGRWDPYIGAGISWAQEVDIDLEGNGPEPSFSVDGGIGGQVFAGSNFRMSDRLSVHGELRAGVLRGIDLDGENVSGTLTDFNYEPLTVQFGVNYRF